MSVIILECADWSGYRLLPAQAGLEVLRNG